MSIIELENVGYRISDFEICKNVSISFVKDAFTGVIGANGSGKSTLLKQIYRVLKPSEGCIYLNGKNINDFSSKQIAREMAVLPQENKSDFDYTVEEIVLMGRFPHHGLFGNQVSRKDDHKIVIKYLELMGLKGSERRVFNTLSGGEKQRVLLARALSQETELVVLDEVTNHLDIGYQYKVLQVLRTADRTVISAIHDLNLAMKFCDYVVLIDGGEVISFGTPIEVITEQMLRSVFKMNAKVVKRGKDVVIDYISSCY